MLRPGIGEGPHPGRGLVERYADPPDVGGRAGRLPARLLGCQVRGGPQPARHGPRPPRQAQVDHPRLPALDDDVRRLQVEVQVAVPVQIADRRADLEAEVGDVRDRQPPRGRVDHVLDCLAAERFHDQDGSRPTTQLIGPDDVGVGQLQQQLALLDQPPAHAWRTPVRPHDLGDAAAIPLEAPGVIHVQRPSTAQVRDHLVTGRHAIALVQQPVDRAIRRTHGTTTAGAAMGGAKSSPPTWCSR